MVIESSIDGAGDEYIGFYGIAIKKEKLEEIQRDAIRLIVSELPEKTRTYEVVKYILEEAVESELAKAKLYL